MGRVKENSDFSRETDMVMRKKYKLKELLTIKNGKDHKHLSKGCYPVFGSGGVMRLCDSYLYDSPSILLPRKGSLGNIQYVDVPFWTVDTIYYTEVDNSKANTYYLYRYLRLLDLSNLDSGTGVPSMTFESYYNVEVWLPDLNTQNLDANVLQMLDRKIALNREINRNLEAMARQLYDYWFVQFDFPDENGRPYKSSGGKMVWNKKLKREIPEGWADGKLIDIANITMGQSPDGSTYNEIGEGIIFYQGSTDFGLRFPSVRQFTTAPTRLAKQGDILMSVRAPVGATNIANTDCCIGRGLAALNSKIGSITLLYHIIQDLKTAFDMRNDAGTTFGSITKDDFYSLAILIPSTSTVARYEEICSSIFAKQMLIGKNIDILIKQRDELLPLLMNGQVSVMQQEVNCDLSLY